jgi:hypothetical protein
MFGTCYPISLNSIVRDFKICIHSLEGNFALCLSLNQIYWNIIKFIGLFLHRIYVSFTFKRARIIQSN